MSDLTPPKRRVRVQASDRDPMTMRFLLDSDVQPGSSASFTAAEAESAPLASALFAIDGVEQVQVGGASIHVRRGAGAEWTDLKPRIAEAIRRVLDTCDHPLGTAQPPRDDDARLLDQVQDLLDRQANPAIAAHGGSVSVDRVEKARVHLRFAGGCQGCAASSQTLREGIETMLRAALPEIAEIIDVTDHDAGVNPYYTSNDAPSPKLTRPVPASVVDHSEGELRIDPEFLARRLGLTPETLSAGLANGDIERHVETRTGQSGPITRVSVFAPTRSWAADLHDNGRIFEVPPPRREARTEARTATLTDRVRAHLNSLDTDARPITYSALARALGLYLPGSVRKVTQALEATMREDAAADRPFVAAGVVNRHSGLPGKGFFDLAQALGRAIPEDQEALATYRQRLTTRP
ncbi:Fe/S biogenesis protein NfuA [Roseovarius tolerans]|uniref:Fe/S biogenesis protein NfuA n=1 Tax=Roseovarius tolerans TaxID=74031 RepID=A0A0L6D099_9RHOB|nr:NifU family protein [Roseovarius tolerans]KNX43395.1 Fe/S biogenesis protein NfuA [Roseovarius tolerans]